MPEKPAHPRTPNQPPAPTGEPRSVPSEFAALDRLRRARVRPERDLTLQRDFAAQTVLLRRLRRSSAGIAEVWNATVPPDLLPQTFLRGLSAAVLSVGVPDQGVRFRLDRWLRAGGQLELSKAARTPIRRVKIVIERDSTNPNGPPG